MSIEEMLADMQEKIDRHKDFIFIETDNVYKEDEQ